MDNQNNTQNRKDFAKKVKNMVNIIGQNLQSHGGSLELLNIDANNAVKLRVRTGGDCPEANEVLENGVKELIKQQLPQVREVITVD